MPLAALNTVSHGNMTTTGASQSRNPPHPRPLSATLLAHLHPQETLRQLIETGTRPSIKRQATDRRAYELNLDPITSANGSTMVRLGNTCVITAVIAEVAEAGPTTPDAGFIVPSVEVSPTACGTMDFRSRISGTGSDRSAGLTSTGATIPFTANPPPNIQRFHNATRTPGVYGSTRKTPSEVSSTIMETICQIMLNAEVVDKKDLVIDQQQGLVWTLYTDTLVLSDDGNAVDAAVASWTCALGRTKLPTVWWDEEEGLVRGKWEHGKQQGKKLPMKGFPLCFTYGLYESDGHHILLSDPDSAEETHLLHDSHLTIAMSDTDRFCLVQKSGDAGHLTPADVAQAMREAKVLYERTRENFQPITASQ